jgi:hypothetical protein
MMMTVMMMRLSKFDVGGWTNVAGAWSTVPLSVATCVCGELNPRPVERVLANQCVLALRTRPSITLWFVHFRYVQPR